MDRLLWSHPVAFLYAQEGILVLAALVLARRGRGAGRPPVAWLALAVVLALQSIAFLPVCYRLGRTTFSYGRLGFHGPGRALAAIHIPLLFVLVSLGRERVRGALLERVPAAPLAAALAVLVPVLATGYVSSARAGLSWDALRLEALAVDVTLSISATALLVLSGSSWCSGAFASAALYLRCFGLSDVESPFQSISHWYASGATRAATYHAELLGAAAPAAILAALALRRGRAGARAAQ